MIITIAGKAGSGKSTIAKLLSKNLHLTHYSVGDVMRAMAAERGMSLLELNHLAEKDKSIDKELDSRLILLGKTKDNFVIDGRLTAHFIPHARYRIFLDADPKVRAERILSAHRKDESHSSLAQTMEHTEAREESERKRYLEYYNVDYTSKKLYTHIIDTTHLDIDGVIKKILLIIPSKDSS